MARRRFLVESIRDGVSELRGEDALHLSRVLRAEVGQQYEITDGRAVCLAEIEGIEKDRVLFRVLEELPAPPETARISVYAAFIKFDRFEWLIEKATELGVAAIVPFAAARSEKGLLEAARKRVVRWRKIAHESAQQSRRLCPPEIGDPVGWNIAVAATASFRYFLDEQANVSPLWTSIPAPAERRRADSLAVLTGPEGGWTDAERSAALAAGWQPASLGPNILRAETAVLAGVAVLTHAWWASQLE